MHINSVKNNRPSFKALSVIGGSQKIQELIKADSSLQELATTVERQYHKHLIVNINQKNIDIDFIYKPFLSIDKGKFRNFLTKIGLGKKIMLCHHHSIFGLERRCSEGLLNYRNLSIENIIKRLGLK